MFQILQIAGVPLLIFSAGIGDILIETIKQENHSFNGVQVISNFMEFNEEVRRGNISDGDNVCHCLETQPLDCHNNVCISVCFPDCRSKTSMKNYCGKATIYLETYTPCMLFRNMIHYHWDQKPLSEF